jgi:hypothetical protein
VRPIRLGWTKLVYHGPLPGIGDLWCKRVRPGLIESVWQPDPGEAQLLANGGAIVLALHSEPIPPISMRVIPAEHVVPVAEHTFRVPAELEEREAANLATTREETPMSYVVYVYRTVENEGKETLECRAYTERPAPAEGFGEPSPLDQPEAEAAAKELQSEGWTAMVLPAEILPFQPE